MRLFFQDKIFERLYERRELLKSYQQIQDKYVKSERNNEMGIVHTAAILGIRTEDLESDTRRYQNLEKERAQ